MPDLPPSKRLRLKFAAIGTVGAAMVLLPLAQVLRYQAADLEAMVAERTTLDPLAHAVAVQRGLLGHRDVAERVLRGRLQLEAERRLRKAEVDDALWALQGTLSAGFWAKALRESDALTQDWRLLAGRVAMRQVQVADNLAGHQLLLEQAVQVMDLVSAAAPAVSSTLSPIQARTPGALPLPQLAALERALQARDAELAARSAALREQQALLKLAVSGVALFALAVALWARRLTAPGGATPPTDGVGHTRRSRGRRSADTEDAKAAPAPQTMSHQVLQRLREAGAKVAAEAQGPQPPPA